jgi:hypothetical protein
LFTWVRNHTQNSLLLAFLFHWSIDAMTNVLPFATPTIAWINVALSWLLVLAVMLRERFRKTRAEAATTLPSQGAYPPLKQRMIMQNATIGTSRWCTKG